MSAKLTVLAGCLVFCVLLCGQRTDIQPPLLWYSPPQLVSSTRPIYPKLARAARIEGTVKLRVTVGTDGSVEQITLIRGHPFLVEAAIEAVKQWQYRPQVVQGLPVIARMTVELTFSLRNDEGNEPTISV
jgi:TonB family protein